MKKKQKDDILGEEQSNLPINEGTNTMTMVQYRADKCTVSGGCPNEKCDSKQAYFYQLQTRSADEPPTSFFKVSMLKSSDVLANVFVVH